MSFVNRHHQQGAALHAEGKFAEAIAAFNKADEQNPKHPEILADRGTTYLLLEKFNLCLIDFNVAAEMEPERAYRFSSRAFAKDRMGDVMGAIADYERAIELDPEDAISMNNLGLLLEYKGSKTQAKTLYNKADELAGQDRLFHPPIKKDEVPESETEKESISNILKSLFTKAGIKDFFRFIANGFKIKDPK